jgi:hypothetical protein
MFSSKVNKCYNIVLKATQFNLVSVWNFKSSRSEIK